MSTNTGIEWTDTTWNPTTGCDQVSPGCDNCYALTLAKRLKGMGSAKYQNDGDPNTSGPGFAATMHPGTLNDPLKWRKPRKVFVNSMSDLFHKAFTDEFIGSVFEVMAKTPQHTYQVLTKRPGRMRSLLNRWAADGYKPLPNVWLGTSVEDQKWADVRIPLLLRTPAAVRFLSCEPLLGPVDLAGWFARAYPDEGPIHWAIAGGESGPGARPMHPDWARTLRDQCVSAGVAFHFKQWGAFAPTGERVGKHAAGRELDGRTWDEWPVAA